LARSRIAVFLSPLAVRTESSDPHLIHGSLDPHESAPKRHLDRFSRFLHSSPVCPTHKQTDTGTQTTLRATSVATQFNNDKRWD